MFQHLLGQGLHMTQAIIACFAHQNLTVVSWKIPVFCLGGRVGTRKAKAISSSRTANQKKHQNNLPGG